MDTAESRSGRKWQAAFMMFAFMASLGLPGLIGFWGEFGIIAAFYQWIEPKDLIYLLVFCLLSLLLTAGYYLWAMQRTLFGRLTTKIDTDLDGWDIYEFELNGQDEDEDLVSMLSVAANNGETGDANSKLFRNITLRVLKKMDMTLDLVPKRVDNLGDVTVLSITHPEDLPGSMFPLIFYIEDINHSLNPCPDREEPCRRRDQLVLFHPYGELRRL